MDYEKKYKEALEKAKTVKITDKDGMDVLSYIFPELAESEDERMMNWLITQLDKNYKGNYLASKAIEYLEKQKGQKPAEINVKALLAADRLASAEMTGRLKERSEILENPEKYGLQKPAEWSEGDKKMLQAVLYSINFTDAHYQFDSKEYSSIQVVDWLLASLRKRVNVNLKPEDRKWSEEDSRNYEFVEGAVRGAYGGEFKTKLIIWLKLLGLRSYWKPSKEQMKILGRFNDPVLKSLYDDLKKLM